MDEVKTPETEEALTTAQQAQPVAPVSGNIWGSMEAMKVAYNMAKVLSTSTLVPKDQYQGNPANCLIALEMAQRTGFSPLHVMQNLYIIQGKPSWSGQFCAAAINACGKFSPLEYVQLLEDDGTTKGYYAQATRLATGKLCVASPVTWDMVKKEGWDKKSGSKWLSMPDLMFHYRAAAFFVREFCPEVLCGLQTAEEVQDVRGWEKQAVQTISLEL